MVVLLLISLIALITYAPPLFSQKQWRDLAVFLLLDLGAVGISVLLIMDVTIPSPLTPLIYLIRDILHLAYPLPQ